MVGDLRARSGQRTKRVGTLTGPASTERESVWQVSLLLQANKSRVVAFPVPAPERLDWAITRLSPFRASWIRFP